MKTLPKQALLINSSVICCFLNLANRVHKLRPRLCLRDDFLGDGGLLLENIFSSHESFCIFPILPYYIFYNIGCGQLCTDSSFANLLLLEKQRQVPNFLNTWLHCTEPFSATRFYCTEPFFKFGVCAIKIVNGKTVSLLNKKRETLKVPILLHPCVLILACWHVDTRTGTWQCLRCHNLATWQTGFFTCERSSCQ